MRIDAVNESTCIVYFGDRISDDTAALVRRATESIRHDLAHLVTDLVPSYTSVMVCYNPNLTDRFGIAAQLRQTLARAPRTEQTESGVNTIELPVFYHPDVGPDLDEVCRFSGLEHDEVIHIHSGQSYRVYAIGFSPGFAYLGITDPRIALPRKSTPRQKVPTGSVGIAGSQTAIYPSATPGGWQIIGRTPSRMIDWDSDSLALVQVGDRVRFRAIDRQEFIALGGHLDEL
ncbi:MAG: 5-oxoprolinase subunit PxpB [Marinobacter sp.]|uniref:5-oxoprolinase subunit PxpB n=1 Tax=Marinobacter sp. TaxID=50741 RepID=UPI00299E6647|nr:5-oxoprolinase subunit PxpB [Marinobacter sp.]MDX1635169.1 5-oxoprolinase subunit PxpB [Marinobacter sp.]